MLIRATVPNPHRTALYVRGQLPDGPLSHAQRAIADAVPGCHALADFAAIPAEAATVVPVCAVGRHVPAAVALILARDGIAAARRMLDRLEGQIAAYGAAAVMPRAEAIPASVVAGARSRHEAIMLLYRHLRAAGLVLIRAGDSDVIRDASGTYRLAEARA